MNTENYNVDIQEFCEFILQSIALTDARVTILKGQLEVFLKFQHPDFLEKTNPVLPKLEEAAVEHLRLMADSLAPQSVEMKQMIESLIRKSQ